MKLGLFRGRQTPLGLLLGLEQLRSLGRQLGVVLGFEFGGFLFLEPRLEFSEFGLPNRNETVSVCVMCAEGWLRE